VHELERRIRITPPDNPNVFAFQGRRRKRELFQFLTNTRRQPGDI
jgi:hypothetical protein